jgi:hypothetical protein
VEPQPDPRVNNREQELVSLTEVIEFGVLLVLICVFKAPGPSGRAIRVYRNSEYRRDICRVFTT